MNAFPIRQSDFLNFLSTTGSKSKKLDSNYKSVLIDELKSEKNFEEMCSETWQKYFGQSSQNYYHVINAAGISPENWSHNDFPYQKFLANNVDESVLTWKPLRINPPQLNSDVQSKLTATLGKHAVIVPPELEEKLKTDHELREKVIANIDKIYKFHTQTPTFKMPGVKEYGTKIFGSVTILNAEGEVENCVVTSGGTIMAPDEETLRQIEHERAKKLKRKQFNAKLLEQARIEYIMTQNLLIIR
ncbi:MAG: hypothetical protein IKO74_02885 [Selenomonadaceae bacterium]|nr:hypothetical protein [Selenomonadaceae bacterium]